MDRKEWNYLSTYPMSATHEDSIQRRLGVLCLGGLLLAPSLSHFSFRPAIISTVSPATWSSLLLLLLPLVLLLLPVSFSHR